jgi:sn-glycerol 3-phosphate transport system ATP-binding protein
VSTIKINGLIKRFGAFAAVDDVSFETGQGEFVALLGPSGCGKSTTLRLIAGLEEATEGSITLDGRDVTNVVAAKRNLSMVFQSYALFPHLNVADNILFGLSVRGVAKSEQKKRLDETARLLGLSHLLDRKPSQLSGGQQQRVALGRALIAGTKICLLDEPLSNLDAKLRAEMRNEIRSLQRRLGITMVFVTHDQTEAMSMADRVILMKSGKVEQSGTPADLYERPASTFVASFIGTPPMNLLKAVQHGGRLAIDSSGRHDSEVILGIRPEHILFAENGQVATVEGSEYFGSDTIVSCRVGAQKVLVRVPGGPTFNPETTVNLAWEETSTRLFDRHTGLHRPVETRTLEQVQPRRKA